MYEIGTWGPLEALLGIALAFRNSVVGKVGPPHPPTQPHIWESHSQSSLDR